MSPNKIEHVVVVIPAHNEQRRLNQALNSATAALAEVAGQATGSIVVVADDCSDSTASLARLRLLDPPDVVITTRLRNPGSARRAGVEAGLLRAPDDTGTVWIASTDADTVVPPDWVSRQLAAAEAGVDAIAGVVTLHRDHDVDHELVQRFDRYYRFNPDGTHQHVHAANLGVRASAYIDVGGWNPLHTGEDHDLWNRLLASGWTTRSCADLRVATSARRRGRARDGFAADIVALDCTPLVA